MNIEQRIEVTPAGRAYLEAPRPTGGCADWVRGEGRADWDEEQRALAIFARIQGRKAVSLPSA